MHVFACICTYMTSASSIAQLYLHISTTYVQYTALIVYYTDMMYIIRTLQYTPVFACIFTYTDSISVQIRAYTYGHGVVMVASRSPALALVSALSLCCRYGKFVARHCKRRQVAQFNQIRSARLNSGSRRQHRATCTGAPQPHAACWSSMAILVTTERGRPGDSAIIG
jgi:hypothetical protein